MINHSVRIHCFFVHISLPLVFRFTDIAVQTVCDQESTNTAVVAAGYIIPDSMLDEHGEMDFGQAVYSTSMQNIKWMFAGGVLATDDENTPAKHFFGLTVRATIPSGSAISRLKPGGLYIVNEIVRAVIMAALCEFVVSGWPVFLTGPNHKPGCLPFIRYSLPRRAETIPRVPVV